MKAISLWQPWATAIALDLKTIETRSRLTHYRGPIAIHAALTKRNVEHKFDIRLWWENSLHDFDRSVFSSAGYDSWSDLPFGAVVATAEIVDCLPTNALAFSKRPYVDPMEYRWGNYQEGRYGWILEKVKMLPKPIPAKGKQGFFTVDL